MSTQIAHLDKAVAAHALWKSRLRDAIARGGQELQAETVQRDNACDFGKWLHESADNSQHATEVRRLHAEFHKAAANVVRQVLAKNTKAAEAALDQTGEFGMASSKLTLAVIAWKQALLAGKAA